MNVPVKPADRMAWTIRVQPAAKALRLAGLAFQQYQPAENSRAIRRAQPARPPLTKVRARAVPSLLWPIAVTLAARPTADNIQMAQAAEDVPAELRPLCAVLDGVSEPGLLVVDGYADPDPRGRLGLGTHAYAGFRIPVIGMAKSRYRTATHTATAPDDGPRGPLRRTAARGLPAWRLGCDPPGSCAPVRQ